MYGAIYEIKWFFYMIMNKLYYVVGFVLVSLSLSLPHKMSLFIHVHQDNESNWVEIIPFTKRLSLLLCYKRILNSHVKITHSKHKR